MDPQCCLCDRFFPLFYEHERDFGIWQVATCLGALMSQFLVVVLFLAYLRVHKFHAGIKVLVVMY
jgi:hypothetical protein